MQPHDFWQAFLPEGASPPEAPYAESYPARLDDGRVLMLPVRPLADGRHALASFIVNQASFGVVDAIAGGLANRLKPFGPDVVVGLPTLGLTLAAAVARELGHDRYVPFGTSRKFWYREELSVPLASVTTPEQRKRLYVDPRLMPLVEGRRVALVDDVISSGASIVAGLRLMALVGTRPVVIGTAMLQTERWRARLWDHDPELAGKVVAAFSTPLLARRPDGLWQPAD